MVKIKFKTGWYLIRKSFKGGGDEYAFRITKKIQQMGYEDWDDLLNFIGEHTGGGHAYGYRITAIYHGKFKPKVKETLRFKKVVEENLVLRVS